MLLSRLRDRVVAHLPVVLGETPLTGSPSIFLEAAKRQAPEFEIKDEQKLLQLALDLGVTIGDRTNNEVAADIGQLLLNEFGKQEGELLLIKRAPLKRQELWRKLGIVPRGIDREVGGRESVQGSWFDGSVPRARHRA